MMRRVRGDAIWLHGSYRFESRQVMRRALRAAEQLIGESEVKRLQLTKLAIVGDDEVAIVVQLPMFEQCELAWALFGLFGRYCCESGFETRVEVL